MKFLSTAILLIALIATPAFAECDISNVSGLTAVAKQELKVACQQAMLKSKQIADNPLAGVDVSNPEKLSQWGLVAQEWAKALGVAANELGLAADTFLDTDAGKLTAAVIIWHVAGESILGFLIGVPLLMVVMVVGLGIARRLRIKEITYGEGRTIFGRRKVETVVMKDRFSDSEGVGIWVAYIATIILSCFTIGAVIF